MLLDVVDDELVVEKRVPLSTLHRVEPSRGLRQVYLSGLILLDLAEGDIGVFLPRLPLPPNLEVEYCSDLELWSAKYRPFPNMDPVM